MDAAEIQCTKCGRIYTITGDADVVCCTQTIRVRKTRDCDLDLGKARVADYTFEGEIPAGNCTLEDFTAKQILGGFPNVTVGSLRRDPSLPKAPINVVQFPFAKIKKTKTGA